MPYNGIEIDMLYLGDADSTLVTQWTKGTPTCILIDGGYAKDAPKVTGFLKERGVTTIPHMVCSHPDDDHAGGLRRIVREGSFRVLNGWVHRPELYIDIDDVNKQLSESLLIDDAPAVDSATDSSVASKRFPRAFIEIRSEAYSSVGGKNE